MKTSVGAIEKYSAFGRTVAVVAAVVALSGEVACAARGAVRTAPAAGGPLTTPDRFAPPSLFVDDLTSPELRIAIARGFTTALVYSGSIEASGPHLALGKHNVRGPFYAERIAREVGHVLVGQVEPFGINGERLAGFPGTIALRPETFTALHEDIVRSLARAGFTRIVLLTEHGGNVAALQALAPRLDSALSPGGVRVVFASDNYTKSTAEIEEWGRAHRLYAGKHGGLWDTSELWVVDSTKVRPRFIALGDTSATPANPAQQVTGDPRHSSAELGQIFADIRVRNGVAEIRRLLKALQ